MTPVTFAGAGLDRADAVRSDADALTRLLVSPRSRLLRLSGLDPVTGDEGALLWGSLAEADGEVALLGLDDEGRGHFVELSGVEAPMVDRLLWGVLEGLSPRDAATYAAARSLVDWHARHGFCGRCGGATTVAKAGWARRCDQCSADHFPRVDPVVIMLVEWDGKLLLGRQPGWPDRRYSALAGFVEPGESIEAAVAREVMEEAGVAVRDVGYIASQPWPFPSSLMIGAHSHADSGELRIDERELEHAFWCDADGVRAALAEAADAPFHAPPRIAIARLLLQRWLDGRQAAVS